MTLVGNSQNAKLKLAFTLHGLAAHTTYHFAIVGSDDRGLATSTPDRTFTTS